MPAAGTTTIDVAASQRTTTSAGTEAGSERAMTTYASPIAAKSHGESAQKHPTRISATPYHMKRRSICASQRATRTAPAERPPMNANKTALDAYAVTPNTYARYLEKVTS